MTLKALVLSGSYLTENNVVALARMLKLNTSIESLNLSNCTITSDGGEAIAEALYDNRTLTKLDLRNNYITDDNIIEDLELVSKNSDGSTRVSIKFKYDEVVPLSQMPILIKPVAKRSWY